MESRYAVERLQTALEPLGAIFEWTRCKTMMTFANGEQELLEWCVHIIFPTTPRICTTIDVLDNDSRIPILLSLQQQMNLRMTYSLEPDVAHVTCPLMHMRNELCTFSNTRHIVIDLGRLCGKVPESSTKGLKTRTLRSGHFRTFSAEEESDAETATTVPSEGEELDDGLTEEDEEEEESEEEESVEETESDEEDGEVLAGGTNMPTGRRKISTKRPSSPEFKAPDLSQANDRGIPRAPRAKPKAKAEARPPQVENVPRPRFSEKVFDPSAPRKSKKLLRGKADRRVVIRKGPADDSDTEEEGERTPQSVPKPKTAEKEGDRGDVLEPGTKPSFDRILKPGKVFDDSEIQVDVEPPPDPPPGPGRVLQKIHDRLRD